jgi:hypothetical protein
MMTESSKRNFKGGSWDLRRQERRQNQTPIPFPDRRQADRRAVSHLSESVDSELTWVSRPGLDE